MSKRVELKRLGNVTLSAPVDFTLAAEGEAPEKSRFSILAYSGAAVTLYGYRFVIRLSGITAKDVFPALYEHDRQQIVGHVDRWTVDSAGMHADGPFSASTETARKVRELAREGFPWQASIGVLPVRITRLERGAQDTVNGVRFEGPIDIWEESAVAEVSFAALGADSNTEARVDASQPQEDGMDPKLRALLVKLGLPEDATNDQAIEFAERKLALKQPEGGGADDCPRSGEGRDKEPEHDGAGSEAAVLAAARLAVLEDRKRGSAIRTLTASLSLPQAFADSLVNEGVSLAEAQGRVLAELAKTNPKIGFSTLAEGESESDKFRSLAAQGVMLRLGYKPGQGERVEPGAEEFRHMGPLDLARLCLERTGQNVRRMSRQDIAESILSPRARLAASTSDFSGLFLDVANRTLQAAYNEAPATWRPIVNVVNATDFRDIYGVQLSGGPDLEDVGENEEYRSGSLKDNYERYRVTKRGKVIHLSFEMIVNDDLNAFARLPRTFGAMAARKHADVVYGILTGATPMRDGKPLFHADHGNLNPSGSVLDSKSLDLAYQAMAGQKGLNGEQLDISPRYLLVPPSLRTTAMVILHSSAQPVSQMSSGVLNVWLNSGITPIVENRLETGGSAKKPWYLMADPSLANVVDVAFLNGKESPDVIEHEEFTVDSIAYKVRTIMGAGAVDFRGAYKNAGAVLN